MIRGQGYGLNTPRSRLELTCWHATREVRLLPLAFSPRTPGEKQGHHISMMIWNPFVLFFTYQLVFVAALCRYIFNVVVVVYYFISEMFQQLRCECPPLQDGRLDKKQWKNNGVNWYPILQFFLLREVSISGTEEHLRDWDGEIVRIYGKGTRGVKGDNRRNIRGSHEGEDGNFLP